MVRVPDTVEDPDSLRDKIIGLGDQSMRKSYYPELQARINELERSKKDLENRSAALLNILEDLEESHRVAEGHLEMFHTMADFTYDWEYWVGPGGDLIYVSPSCERITGYSPEEFQKNPGLIGEIVHPGDSGVFDAHQARIETAPGVHSLDFRILRRDGSLRWIAHICQPVTTRDGTPQGVRVSNRDITERREAEEKVKLSEQRLIDIINHLPDATLAIDGRHTIIAWNRAMEELSGVPAAEMMGRGDFEYSIPIYGEKRPLLLDLVLDDEEKIRRNYPDLVKTGDKFISEFHIPKLYGGKGAHVWCIASPLYDADGRIVGAIESVRDVTERKLAEEAVKKSGQEWQATFNAINDGVFLLDPESRIVRHNQAFEMILGKPAEEIDGRYCYELLHGTPAHPEGCPWARAQESCQRESLELMVGDRWFIASVDPVFSDAGTITGCVHLLTDITARKRTEEALMQARKKLTMLNAITFSDIQNSVFSLSGFIELEKQCKTDEKLQQYKEKEKNIIEVISDSLKYAGIYQSLGLKPPEWQNVVQSFLIAISHLDLARFQRKLEIPGVEVYADPMLENVFFALADNIVEHAKTATEYSFTCTGTTEGLVLVFEDNGQGIPHELKEKVFDREYSRRKGIGLYLSREILSITGITIRESGESGKGARFEIIVPKGAYRFTDPKKSE